MRKCETKFDFLFKICLHAKFNIFKLCRRKGLNNLKRFSFEKNIQNKQIKIALLEKLDYILYVTQDIH